MSKAVGDGLAAESVTVTGSWAYDPSAEDFSSNAATALGTAPDAVAVIGGPPSGPKVIGALSTSGVPIYVNSGLRVAKLAGDDPTQKNNPPVIAGVSVAADPTTGSAGFSGLCRLRARRAKCLHFVRVRLRDLDRGRRRERPDRRSLGHPVADDQGQPRRVICRSFADCVQLAAAGVTTSTTTARQDARAGDDGSPTRAEFDVFGFFDETART